MGCGDVDPRRGLREQCVGEHRLGEFRPCPELVSVLQRALRLGKESESSTARPTLSGLVRLLARIDHFPGGVIDELLENRVLARELTEAGAPRLLEELGAELARCRGASDLLDSTELSAEDRAWAGEVYEELRECAHRRPGLRLVQCQHRPGPHGHLGLSFAQHHVARHVEPGDRVLAGFSALRLADGALRIRPRIYRVLCTNGVVVPDATAEELVSETGSVRAAVRHCLSASVVDRVVQRMRAARRVLVRDPFVVFPRLADSLVARSVRRCFEAAEEATLLGAVNAVTAAAREERDFARRTELENAAGRLLASFSSSALPSIA